MPFISELSFYRVADKKKYKEIIDQHKREIEELTQKLMILDRKIRLQEQLSRDPNMVKMENAIEEEINEIQELRDSHAALEAEIAEKRQLIASLSTELSDAKIELAANAIKIEYLNNKVDELTRNEDVTATQLEKMTKDFEDYTTRIYMLEEETKEITKTLEAEKNNYWKLRDSIDDTNRQYEMTIAKNKKQLDEAQDALRRAIDEKEFVIMETNGKISRLTQDNRQLTIERDQLRRDHGHLIKAVQFTAKTTKSLLQEFNRYEQKTNKTLEDHLKQTQFMKDELSKLHSNLTEIMESSEKRMQEMEQKFQSKQQNLLKSMEESNEAMKGLQAQIEQQRKENAQLQLESSQAKVALLEAEERTRKLEVELNEEKNSEKQISPEELERIKAEEREIWERKLKDLEAESLQQIQSYQALIEQSSHESLQLKALLQAAEEKIEQLKEDVSTANAQAEEATQRAFDAEAAAAAAVTETDLAEEDNEVSNNIRSVKSKSRSSAFRNTPMKLLIDQDTQTSTNDLMQEDDSLSNEIKMDKIEQILRNSLITNNYYFSREINTFTNSYPIDEAFLQDLVRSFHYIGKETFGLLAKAKEFQPSNAELSGDTERFLGFVSQDLLIKLEKSKEEIIVKVKNEAKDEMTERIEATIKQLNDVKHAELFEQREVFNKEINALKQQHERKLHDLNEEMDRMREEFEEEILVLQQEQQQVPPKDLTAKSEDSDSSKLRLSDALSNSQMSRQNSIASSKRPTMLSLFGGKGARSSMRSFRTQGEPVTLDSLSETDRSAFKDQLRDELEAEIRERLQAEFLEKQKVTDLVMQENSKLNMMKDLMKDLPAKYQNKDLQSMREELLTGDLMNIGNVQNENFDRLRNKNFGPDTLIALTILEHHARYDDGNSDSNSSEGVLRSSVAVGSYSGSFSDEPQQRQYRMQLKALEIKRKLLTQQIVGEVSVLDLLSYLHATEEHLALLSSLNAWKSLLYYQSGGIFRDVLEVHLDVIKSCLKEAGGMTAAIRAVAQLPANSKTTQWPEHFRIKALEMFRVQLLQDNQRQSQSISDLIAQFASNDPLSKDAEEKIMRSLSNDHKRALRQSRSSLQQEKLKQATRSVSTLNETNESRPKNEHVESSSRPDSASSSSEVSQSIIPPIKDAVSMRRNEFLYKPPETRIRRSHTWRMKSERGFDQSGIAAASRDDLIQIAESMNMIQEMPEPEIALNNDGFLSYMKNRTLHGRIDEIIFASMRGDDAARKLLVKLLDGFYNWEQNNNITANNIFQSCLGFNSEVDIVLSSLVKASLNNDIPLLMGEIYEKIRNFIDYSALITGPESSEKKGQIPPPTNISPSNPLVTRSRTIGKTSSFDCGTQTDFQNESGHLSSVERRETSSLSSFHIPTGFRLALLQEGEFEIAPGVFIASLQRLILTIKSQDPKLNKWKSMTAAAANLRQTQRNGTSVSSSIFKNRNKSIEVLLQELSELPDHIRYCFGPAITPFTQHSSGVATISLPTPLQKAPYLLDLLVIKDCIPVLFPAVFPLSQGINLITGFKYHEQGNDHIFTKLLTSEGKNCSSELITFPRDVLLLQIAQGLDLPKGLYPIEFSNQLAYDASLFFTQRKVLETAQSALVPNDRGDLIAQEWAEIKLPPGHELVQLVNCCIDFPVGVEVSNGVRIAPVPANIMLPSNVKIVQKFKKTPLPDFMIALKYIESKPHDFSLAPNLLLNANNIGETDIDSIPELMRQSEGVTVVARPNGINFQLGQELVRRPVGHPLPCGMKLVPRADYPPGFELPRGCELVQLSPKYDLPVTCRLNSSWYVYPRPNGVHLRSNQYLVYPDPALEDHMVPPLPPFACQMGLPNLPYGVKLPNRTVCVELLLTRITQQALPEGVIIAPGITVLNPRQLHGWQEGSSRCPINILLVKRSAGTRLPRTVERGSRSDLPNGVLLGENMDVLKITTRFELPPGVKVEVGVSLGQYVQLAPGTQLISSMISSSKNKRTGSYLNSLTVLEWPYGVILPPGIELVRRPPPECFLPFEYQQVISPNFTTSFSNDETVTKLPEESMLIKLPRAIKTATCLELSEQVTIGLESMVDYPRPLPEGMIFASRVSRHSIWPAEMRSVPASSLTAKLVQVLEAANQDNPGENLLMKGGSSATLAPPSRKTQQRLNVEVVQLHPSFDLPGGVYLHPEVVTVTKPFCLSLPPSVVLVELKNIPERENILKQLAVRGIHQIDVCLEHRLPLNFAFANKNKLCYQDISSKDNTSDEETKVDRIVPEEWSLNSSLMYLQLPDVFDVYSWGNNLPGVEAVSWSENRPLLALPPGHFLIERPRQFQHDELPPGFTLGIREEYRHLRTITKAGSFPPQIEIMHITPSFHLPLGVHLINTSAIGRNTFNNNSGNTLLGLQGNSYTKKVFDPFWIPQFAPLEHVSRDAVVIPWPRDLSKHLQSILSQVDPQFFQEPYILVWILKNVTKQEQDILETAPYPPNLVKHPYSNEIIHKLFQSQEDQSFIQELLQYTRKTSELGRFQDTRSSINSSAATAAIRAIKIHHVLHVVRVSNGFPSLTERYRLFSTKSHLSSITSDSPSSDVKTGNELTESEDRKQSLPSDKKIVVHPKLTRIERIKVMNISAEIKKFLEQLLIFRFQHNTSKEELKEKLDYLQFDLIESSLWKAMTANQELEKNYEKLAIQNDKLEKENQHVMNLMQTQQLQLEEMKQSLQHEEDLKAIISKLKDQLTKKDQEISDIMQQHHQLSTQSYMSQLSQSPSIEELQGRYKQQMDIMTSQIVNYENHIQNLEQQLRDVPAAQIKASLPNQSATNSEFDNFQQKITNALENVLLMINSFIIHLIAQIDSQIFSQISKDYALIDLFQEVLTKTDVPQPIQALMSHVGAASSHQSILSNASRLDDMSLHHSHGVDDNTSVITENSLSSKLFTNISLASSTLAPSAMLPPSVSPAQSVISVNSNGNDLTRDVRGKKLGISADFPLDVKALYRHQPEEKLDFISLNKPLLMSKSLDAMIHGKGKNLSTSLYANNHSLDFPTLSQNIDLFLQLKQQKQSHLFSDSILFNDAAENASNTKENHGSLSISTSEPPSPTNPSLKGTVDTRPHRRNIKNAEMDLLQWKSEVENDLLGINSLFQEAVHSIMVSNESRPATSTGGSGSPTRRSSSSHQEVQSTFIDDVSEGTSDSRISTSEKRKRKSTRDRISHVPQVNDINWSGIEVSLQLMTQKVINIFQQLLRKYQSNYHSLLTHIECENQILVRVVKQLRLHANIMRRGSNAPQDAQSSLQVAKEKILQLETRIEQLHLKQIQSDVSPMQQAIQDLQQQSEIEKSLKFLILMAKQMIAKDQHLLNQMSVMPVSEDRLRQMDVEKEIKAMKHNISRLKHQVKDYEDRLQILQEEIQTSSTVILQNIEKFHQQVHSLLPPKLLSVLLSRGHEYYEKINGSRFRSPDRDAALSPTLVSNKTLLSPLALQQQNLQNSKISSDASVNSLSSSSLPPVTGNIEMNEGKRKFQSIIGSMPPAPTQSQFSNRQKHQNEQLAQVNKFFEHTYRKHKF